MCAPKHRMDTSPDMRKLEFIRLSIEGFKSFAGGPHTFQLSERGEGLHFIKGRNEAEPRLGPNGAGKSSVFDAMCWCLYGRTPSGLRNPDIKPRLGNKKTTVCLVMKIAGKKHTIIRTANPNTTGIDDRSVGQDAIDKLLGLSYETFTHTILLGQGQPLFFDLAPREKMQLFSDVLSLERWEERSAVATSRVREFEQAAAVLEGELTAIDREQEHTRSLRDTLKKQSAEWELKRSDKQANASEELSDMKRRLANAQKAHDELDPKHDWAMAQLGIIDKDMDKSEAELLGIVSKLEKANAQMLALKREAKELADSLVNKECPTCGQVVKSQADRVAVRNKLTSVEAEALQINKRVRILTKKTKRHKKQHVDLRTHYEELREDAESMKAMLETLSRTISDLRAQAQAKQREINERGEQDNPYKPQLKDLRRTLDKLVVGAREKKAEKAKLERRTERARFWVKGFKDVRLYVVEEVLQDLELATNAALEDVGLIGWEVNYNVEKETKSGTKQRELSVLIKSPETKERVRWESWSGGEGQRLRIVGALALSEVLLSYAGVQTSIEVLDEPAHFMAQAGIRDLTDFLAWRAQGLHRATFYVDHVSLDSSRFASVTTIVKTKEGSFIDA